jgi:hypothetical protein
MSSNSHAAAEIFIQLYGPRAEEKAAQDPTTYYFIGAMEIGGYKFHSQEETIIFIMARPEQRGKLCARPFFAARVAIYCRLYRIASCSAGIPFIAHENCKRLIGTECYIGKVSSAPQLNWKRRSVTLGLL